MFLHTVLTHTYFGEVIEKRLVVLRPERATIPSERFRVVVGQPSLHFAIFSDPRYLLAEAPDLLVLQLERKKRKKKRKGGLGGREQKKGRKF